MKCKESKIKYEKLYRKNDNTGNVIIDVVLEDYMNFFDEWDNASFKKRDMHPELAKFLDRCSEDIPIKENMEINFCVKHENKDEEKEKLIICSYKGYYAFYNRIKEKKIRGHLYKALLLVMTSISILLCYELLSNVLPESVWSTLLFEGMIIGGWVFLWEALHVITFHRHEHVLRNKEIKRLLRAPIIFEYKIYEI